VDGALSRARSQSGQRLHSDSAYAAGLPRVLLVADDRDPAAWRAVRRLDPRSVATGSLLRDAGARGCLADHHAVGDAADRSRSHATEDDDDHADRADLRLRVDAGRRADLLACQQRLATRAAIPHELLDWSAKYQDDTSRRRKACETSGRRQDGRRRKL